MRARPHLLSIQYPSKPCSLDSSNLRNFDLCHISATKLHSFAMLR